MQLTNLLQLRALVEQGYHHLDLFTEDGFELLSVTLDPFANIRCKVMVPLPKADVGACAFEIVIPVAFSDGLRDSGFNALLLTYLADQFVAAIPAKVLPKCSPAIRHWAAHMQRVAPSQVQEWAPAKDYRDRAKEILRQLLLDHRAGTDPAIWRDPTPEQMERLIDSFSHILAEAARGLWQDVLPAAVLMNETLTEQEMQLVEESVRHRSVRIVRYGA